MIDLYAQLSPQKVEAYARELTLPNFLAHTCLEPLSLDLQETVSRGKPIHLQYTAPGRFEDHYLEAKEHAQKMIPWLYNDNINCRIIERHLPSAVNTSPPTELRIMPIPDVPLWHWADGSLRIPFMPQDRTLGVQGPECRPADTYVSVSRKEVFVAYPVIRNYMIAWLEKIGLGNLEAREAEWKTSGSCCLLDADPFSMKLQFSDMPGVNDLLYFARLDRTLKSIHTWGKLDLEVYPQTALEATPTGIHFRMAE